MNTFLQDNDIIKSLGYLTVAFVLFLVAKVLYKVFNNKVGIDNELVEKDNLAFSISYTGYFTGIIIILVALLSGKSYGFLVDIQLIGLYSFLGFLALNVSQLLTNTFILHKFSVKKELLEDQNEGAGAIQAAVFIANAFLLHGALLGESGSLLEGIVTFISYWAIGNTILILSCKIFTLWIPYDIHKEIEKDNAAAGVAFAGAIVAIGLVIMNALSDPFVSWQTSLLDIVSFTCIGIILLPITRFIVDKILLPKRKLTDEIANQSKPNIGAGILEAFAYVATAVLIVWTF